MNLEYAMVVRYLQALGNLSENVGTFQSDARTMLYVLADPHVRISEYLHHVRQRPSTKFEVYLNQLVG